MAFVAGFATGLLVLAINGFCQYPCAGGFSYAAGAAKKKSMGKLFVPDGIFKRCSNMTLTHYRVECLGTVFSGRNNEFVHGNEVKKKRQTGNGKRQKANDNPGAAWHQENLNLVLSRLTFPVTAPDVP